MNANTFNPSSFKLVHAAAMGILLLGGVVNPALANLLVSDFGTRSVGEYTNGGSLINANFLSDVGGGGEGVTCLLTIGGVPVLFVANNSSTIKTYNAETGALINGNFATVTGEAASFTSLSLSKDGSTLYAAGNNFHLYAFNTSTPGAAPKAVTPSSSSANVWHDITVDPLTGDVYATDFTAGTHAGVDKFSADFTIFTPSFIAPPSVGDYAGLTFDKNGNLWVSNFAVNLLTNGLQPGVYEFTPGNSVPLKIFSTLFNNPLGLAIGPVNNDNIYVANFSYKDALGNLTDGQILTINPSTGNVTTFISDAGYQPKYLEFTENCCVAVPEPNSLSLMLISLLGIANAFWKNNWGRRNIALQRNEVI